jgi:hypothetical protein
MVYTYNTVLFSHKEIQYLYMMKHYTKLKKTQKATYHMILFILCNLNRQIHRETMDSWLEFENTEIRVGVLLSRTVVSVWSNVKVIELDNGCTKCCNCT